MPAGQIVPEVHDIATEGGDRGGRDKAVRLLGTAAVPQLPGMAANASGVYLRADGLDATITSEPANELVLIGPTGTQAHTRSSVHNPHCR